MKAQFLIIVSEVKCSTPLCLFVQRPYIQTLPMLSLFLNSIS